MICMIAAVGKKMELGKNNNLLWHIPNDMKFFRDMTMGHTVVMGRKTYESLPSNGLPGRKMIVISTKALSGNNYEVSSVDKIVNKYSDSEEEIFIIGGGSMYKEFLPYAKKMYLTEINATDKEADVFFPQFNKKEWKKKIISRDMYNDISFSFCLYTR